VAGPGDMKYLMSLARPKIAIITDITQRYIESFSDMDELAGEYEHFIKSMNQNGYLILNHDNQRIKKLAKFKNDNTIFFGLKKSDRKNYWRGEAIEKTLNGQKVRVTHDDQATDYQINRFGQHHVYALLIGLIVKKIVITHKSTN